MFNESEGSIFIIKTNCFWERLNGDKGPCKRKHIK